MAIKLNPIVVQMDKMVKRQAVTPGGLLMDIVLTPALKPGPRLALNLPLASTETNFPGLCHSRAVPRHPLVNGFLQLKLAALQLMA